ncbi:hypothetical protein EIP86_003160 [Pleurotus ostreatoroseus]|nr:hypothetical protein EIP86_003160 [Pleurotus ostreatoroseus]
MSTSSSTACSSSPTFISPPTTESSPPPSSSSTSSSPPRSRRKSPPPPKLNLDELKPILPASLATSGTSTSFVFTSSRTIRSLHNHSRSLNDAHPPTPSAEAPSSPQGSVPDSPSSTTSSSPSPHFRKNPKPVLSSVQLARHSQGAVDARCIVSSNMRAAGFVPLAHTPFTGPYNSIPSTPGSSGSIPTPMDPPRFPPIVFVNPTNVTSTSMWEYQRSFTYGAARGSSNGLGLSIGEATVPIRPSLSSSLSSEGSTLDKISQSMSSFSSSHSSLFSPATASSSSSSLTSQSPPSSDKDYAHHRRVHSAESFEPVIDGFPFPHTPPRTRKQPQSRIQGDTSPLQLFERFTQSPSTSCSTASGSATPLAVSPASSFASLPSTSSIAIPIGRDHSASSSRSSTRFSSASSHDAPSRQRSDLSLTELCSTSPRAWVADPVLLPPFSSSRREAVKTRTRVISRTASGKEAGRKGIAAETILEEPEKHLTAAETMSQSDEAHTSTQKRSSALLPPIALTSQKSDDVRLEKGKCKEQERHRGREKDRDHDREKARDKDREKRKMKAVQRSHSSSSPNSTSSSGHDDKGSERSSRKSRDRTRSTKEKALGYSSYSSFSFPPRESRDSKLNSAHTLGGRDIVLEREREWAAGEHAKDIVLAHRERDREHARQTESWHGTKVVHGTHKKRYAGPEGALAAPLTFSTAYDSGYGRGIGRGRGRGEHAGLRGRSGKTMASVAPSIVSEGETMVQEQLEALSIATDA